MDGMTSDYTKWLGFSSWAGEELARLNTIYGDIGINLPMVRSAEESFECFLTLAGEPFTSWRMRGRELGEKYGLPSKTWWLGTAEILRVAGNKPKASTNNQCLTAFAQTYQIELPKLVRFLGRSVLAETLRQIMGLLYSSWSWQDLGAALSEHYMKEDPSSTARLIRDGGLVNSPSEFRHAVLARATILTVSANLGNKGEAPKTRFGLLGVDLRQLTVPLLRELAAEEESRNLWQKSHGLSSIPRNHFRIETDSNPTGPVQMTMDALGFAEVDAGYAPVVDAVLANAKPDQLEALVEERFFCAVARLAINLGIAEGVSQKLDELSRSELARFIVQAHYISVRHLLVDASEEQRTKHLSSPLAANVLWGAGLAQSWSLLPTFVGAASVATDDQMSGYTLAI